MVFEFKIAIRYLTSARLQSSLLVFGVAVGVVVFTFIAALINGLSIRLTDDVTGNVAHVTLEPELRLPRTFMTPLAGRAMFAIQPGHDFKPVIRSYRSVLKVATQMPGIQSAVAEVVGNATLTRGEKAVAISVTGLEGKNANDIAPLGRSMVRGRLDLGVGSIVVGSRLAAELGIDIGDRVILRSAQSSVTKGVSQPAATVMVVRGVFTLGVQAVDERAVYIELTSAKKIFDVADGISVIELKVDDVWQAPILAERLARATHLKASNWLDRNARLQEGLRAQASTSDMIKAFSLLTIAIGVASALFLSVSRRRSDIGILRSFGIGRSAIIRTFLLQGLLIGTVGAIFGAFLGFGFAQALLIGSMKATGTPFIPIDPAQGEYFRAIILAVVVCTIAAALPAWSAAKIDPLEAIQS